jgi:hypothetical protein
MIKIRLKVDGEELSLPREMVGRAAAAAACKQLRKSGALRLRRVSDHSFVGDATPIGDVLQDGAELELVAGEHDD